jgi:signal-transduction protein with cAMP-binding, CBS, and nucleotidyltransferase domain
MNCPACGHNNIEGVDECEVCQEPFAPSETDSERSLSEAISNDPLSVLDPVSAVGVTPEATVAEVMQLLAERNIGCVLVVEDERLVGIFSERDVLRRIGTRYHEVAKDPIRKYMTGAPETLTAQDSIAFALNRMDVNDFRHIPIEQDGRVVGIISVRDVLAFIVQHFPELSAHQN